MAQSFPKLIDLSQDSFIGLLDIDQMHDRHPTGPAGQPKHFRTIAFGIEVVTAERADMIHHRIDPQTFADQSSMKEAQIVKRLHTERDLIDQVRLGAVRSAAKERDLMIHARRIDA